MSWNLEKEEKLKKLWGKGSTASEIAQIIGGVTRNAVIGKAHRLNLAAKSGIQKIKKSKEEKKGLASGDKKVSIRSRFKSILLDKDFEPENPKSLEELTEKTCKWPIGHPNEESFYFCGRSSIKGYSYCRLHVLYSFQIRGDNKEDGLNAEEAVPKFIEEKIKSTG